MTPVQALTERLRVELPQAKVSVDEPMNSSGPWMVDVLLGGRQVTVEWRKGRGFGVTLRSAGEAYGEEPHDTVAEVEEAVRQVMKLLAPPVGTADRVVVVDA